MSQHILRRDCVCAGETQYEFVFLKDVMKAEEAGLVTLVNTGDTSDTIESRLVFQVRGVQKQNKINTFFKGFLANNRS